MPLIKIFTTTDGANYKVFLTKDFPKSDPVEENDGVCLDPKSKKPAIFIDSDLEGFRLAEIIIHEIAHAFFWNAKEERVEEYARVVAETLRNQGLIK